MADVVDLESKYEDKYVEELDRIVATLRTLGRRLAAIEESVFGSKRPEL